MRTLLVLGTISPAERAKKIFRPHPLVREILQYDKIWGGTIWISVPSKILGGGSASPSDLRPWVIAATVHKHLRQSWKYLTDSSVQREARPYNSNVWLDASHHKRQRTYSALT